MSGLNLVTAAKKDPRVLIALCVVLVFLLPWAASAAQTAENDLALRIVDKSFNEETGELRVQVQNTSENLTVTAFGVMAVVGSADGEEATQIASSDLIPGGGLPPGGIKEVNFSFGFEASPGRAGLSARTVTLHYEVLSNLISHGNQVFVDEVFQARAFSAVEYQEALLRLQRERTVSAPSEAAMNFKSEEVRRAMPAKLALSVPVYGMPSETSNHYAAMKSIASLAGQMDRVIASTGSADAALDHFEWVLKLQFERYFENVRPQDFERIGAWRGAGDE